MRILTRAIAILLAGAVLFAGCDSLNLQPKDELASDQVWNDPALTKSFLHDVYEDTGHGYGSPMFTGMDDDSQNPKDDGCYIIMRANITPTNRGKWGNGYGPMEKFNWEDVYSNVRDLNLFLKNVKESEALPSDMRETLLGEAYFLRAWFYQSLLRAYGGVPYITNTFELSGDLEQYQVPRNTFEKTVDNIVADLDSAATRLPVEARRKGAATKGAALALKCRVRVHAASDLFAENPSGMEVTGYTGGSQQERWQMAESACQEVIDMNEYSLEQTSSAEAYHELFTKGNESGTIWARYFSESGGGAHDVSLWLSTNGWRGWSGETPTQKHVDAYEMADGSQFEWEGGDPTSAEEPIDAENPYKNRDPRFYANVFYNGSDWRPRPEGAQSIDPKGVVQTGFYEMPNREDMRPGLDTRKGPIEPWNGTRTGYAIKKFIDRDIDPKNAQAYNPWVFMRYAEVLLNKAEAEANLGNTEAALSALNKVRSRVGMPSVTQSDLTADRTLMERIRRERRIELAFEEFRYFDLRRWMIAKEETENAKGILIHGNLAPDDGELLSKHRYDYKYQVIKVSERRWDDKMYFVPISNDEMNKNPELVQNPGY